MVKVALILGVVGMLLGGVVLLVSLLLPSLTEGRTSWDESMLGIILGVLVLTGSFVLAAVSTVLIVMRRKKLQA